MGEAMFRGDVAMKGYLKDEAATGKAFAGGRLPSGDFGAKHPHGYVQLKERSKGAIMSGGETISSIAVEDALFRRHGVQLTAALARPDDKWGATACAFVALKPGQSASEAELIAWRLAHYKGPRHIVFAEIPRTSTGKAQRLALRERARAIGPTS